MDMFRKGCLLPIVFVFVFYPFCSFAAHPFKTKHANAYGKDNIRFLIEGKVAQEGGHEKHYDLPVMEVTYSLGDWTLIGVESEYKFLSHSEEVHSTSGSGDVKVYFRHSPFHLEYGHIGAQVGVKFPAAKDDRELGTGEMDYEFTLIHSYFSEHIVTHLNCGVEILGNPKHRSQHEAVFRYSAVAVFPINRYLKYFAEIEGRSARSFFDMKVL